MLRKISRHRTLRVFTVALTAALSGSGLAVAAPIGEERAAPAHIEQDLIDQGQTASSPDSASSRPLG